MLSALMSDILPYSVTKLCKIVCIAPRTSMYDFAFRVQIVQDQGYTVKHKGHMHDWYWQFLCWVSIQESHYTLTMEGERDTDVAPRVRRVQGMKYPSDGIAARMILVLEDIPYPGRIIPGRKVIRKCLLFNLLVCGYPDEVRVGEVEWFPGAAESGQESSKRCQHRVH